MKKKQIVIPLWVDDVDVKLNDEFVANIEKLEKKRADEIKIGWPTESFI